MSYIESKSIEDDFKLNLLMKSTYMSIFDKYGHKLYIMNISFTKKQEEYISCQVKSGDYQNNSELVSEAIRLHQIYRERLIIDLQKEIEKGLESGYSNNTINDILKSKLK